MNINYKLLLNMYYYFQQKVLTKLQDPNQICTHRFSIFIFGARSRPIYTTVVIIILGTFNVSIGQTTKRYW